MSNYTYTFDLRGKDIEISACNLATACETLLNDKHGLSNFVIEKRGTHYLQSTPFNERTHIVKFNGTTICKVKQRKN